MPPNGGQEFSRPVKRLASRSRRPTKATAAPSPPPPAKKAAAPAKKAGRPAGITKKRAPPVKRAAPTTQANGDPVRKSNRLANRRPSMGPLSAPKRPATKKAATKKDGIGKKSAAAAATTSPVEKAGPVGKVSDSLPSTEKWDNRSKSPSKSNSKSKSPSVSPAMRKVADGRVEKGKSDKPRSKSTSPVQVVKRPISR